MRWLVLLIFVFPTICFARDGIVVQIPYVEELPSHYENITPVTYQGGEMKFGKWRNFFNGYEMGWGITYNSRWNFQDNTWEPRDSVDSRSNICAMMRFNVAEGNIGGNVFEINFAAGSDDYISPDWNAAASYFFFDGNSINNAPAKFQIHAGGNSSAMIQLCPNEGALPNRLNLRNSAEGKFFIERESIAPAEYWPYYYIERTTRMIFDKGFIGINHENPDSELDVLGKFTLRAINEIFPAAPGEREFTEDRMTLWLDKNTGNVMIEITFNKETKSGILLNFNDLQNGGK